MYQLVGFKKRRELKTGNVPFKLFGPKTWFLEGSATETYWSNLLFTQIIGITVGINTAPLTFHRRTKCTSVKGCHLSDRRTNLLLPHPTPIASNRAPRKPLPPPLSLLPIAPAPLPNHIPTPSAPSGNRLHAAESNPVRSLSPFGRRQSACARSILYLVEDDNRAVFSSFQLQRNKNQWFSFQRIGQYCYPRRARRRSLCPDARGEISISGWTAGRLIFLPRHVRSSLF
jgi:hypothetical protein